MRGKIAIIVMLGVAVVAAGFAWYQNYHRSVRARAFWGEKAATIRFAKKVEAFHIKLPDDPQHRTNLHPEQGGPYPYAEGLTDISNAPGLLNARTSLMSDGAFDWSVERFTPKPSGEWKLGVRFIDDDETVTLLFSDQSDLMLVGERGQAVKLDSKTAGGWRSYLTKSLARKAGNEGPSAAR